MNNQYVVIFDNSAGNDSVGEMWQETKIFEGTATLDEVMAWAMGSERQRDLYPSRKHIQITKPHGESE